MRKLILMRHAESGAGKPGLGDHERSLNALGRADAPVMARWLAAQDLLPETILCSSARRTCETVELMREAVPGMPNPIIEPALYHATPEQILAALRQIPSDTGMAMIVGHEPGLSVAAHRLDDQTEPGDAHQGIFTYFSPAAIAVFRFVSDRADWSNLTWGAARLSDFVKPRDLMREID